jgi:acetyl-CoA synthetase
MSIKAYVVPARAVDDAAALTSALQDYVKRTLLPHSYPRQVEFLAELPKTGSNKIDRQALLQRAAAPVAGT